MADYTIKNGFDIALGGKPSTELVDCTRTDSVCIYPLEFAGVKQRLKVAEGDAVRKGTELLEDKRNTDFKLRSPGTGVIKKIVRGERRYVEQIIVELDKTGGEAERFRKFSADEIRALGRGDILSHLVHTGYLAFIVQRPFQKMADIKAVPKSIFVNAMNTGPYQADAGVVVQDAPEAFQAGLRLLARLTEGDVHLCMPDGSAPALLSAEGVKKHTFSGPHPSGNTSVHIACIDPIDPGDVVWTVKAADLVQIGRLFLDGELPETRIVSLGGNGVKQDSCKHYRVRVGGELKPLLSERLKDGEQHIISGDALSGSAIGCDGHFRFNQSATTVVPEGRRRRFMGWMMPGFDRLSFTNLFASRLLPPGARKVDIDTNLNGGHRAMVGSAYNAVMPLNIMVDFLVRAVLAGDADEAISLGILETAPEDFALCDFICPSKTEVQEIIRKGLEQIEREGI